MLRGGEIWVSCTCNTTPDNSADQRVYGYDDVEDGTTTVDSCYCGSKNNQANSNVDGGWGGD